MKLSYFLLLLVAFCGPSYAQLWKSIPKAGTYSLTPSKFRIDPYRNHLWIIQDLRVAVIENDGSIRQFYETAQMPGLYPFNDLSFAFTPSHIYYSDNQNGLYNFDNYTGSLVYPHAEIGNLSTEADTVYVINTAQNQGFYKFSSAGLVTTNKAVDQVAAKNGFVYCDIGVIARISGPGSGDWNILYSDPQYMGGAHHEFKFTRLTDSLYVCGKKGISYAYAYDFLDSIAPGNSMDMPARNVLEIEFDDLDRLWAVFGDANDKAFSLAMYDNGTWINKYDESNSPIDFSTFKGLEIDTLGNLWVIDNDHLHTLLSANSPAWLSTEDLPSIQGTAVFPNPSPGVITIIGETVSSVKIFDCAGRLVYNTSFAPLSQYTIDLSSLQNGTYMIRSGDGNSEHSNKILIFR